MAAGAHGALPHAVPRDVRDPAPGTLVVVDMGAQVDGYCSDCTRTFATGPLDDDAREVYELVLRAQAEALAAVRAGAALQGGRRRGARRRSRPPATASGSGTASATEWGSRCTRRRGWRKTAEGALAAGNVVTVEPGVYLPGELRACGSRTWWS